jgi:hypothetical protein
VGRYDREDIAQYPQLPSTFHFGPISSFGPIEYVLDGNPPAGSCWWVPCVQSVMDKEVKNTPSALAGDQQLSRCRRLVTDSDARMAFDGGRIAGIAFLIHPMPFLLFPLVRLR